MESSRSQSDEAKEVLQASLFLSVLKHTGDRISEGDEPARSEDVPESSSGAPLRQLRRSNPPIVRRVNALIDSIGRCRGPFEKRLKSSDLREQQNRLLLWKDHVREFILPLLEEDDDPAQGVEVMAFNTEGKTFPLRFKIWCNKVYVLMGNWKAFVEENQLEDADVLKIWAFRDVRTERLCFLISRTPNAPGQNRTEKGARREGRKRIKSKPQKALLSG
ncbi:B3 domain-containing protein At1g05920-like [Syzygium oleosum]|uniref:B3 domain-containing protein At1g05920-like n=1 Tax=Syzygium oleosum TaxID=219896 RepID=UPI0024BB7BD4|nr:B3 domain-containing protein At1g05920-like [Syzygium oleosum]